MTRLIISRPRTTAAAAFLGLLWIANAHGATKERVYTMGDNDPGAAIGGFPPLVTTISPNRRGTVDIQESTTDYGSVDPPLNQNSSLVPMVSFNQNFAPVYVSAAGRPGAAPGSFALEFDGLNDNMFSASPTAGSYSFDPRDFGGGFGVLAQAWVKPTSAAISGQQFIFRIGAENGTAKISPAGFWTLQTGNTSTPPDLFEVESTVPVALNTWTHVAVVRGGNDSTLYINGAIAARDLGFWAGDGPEVTLGANTFGTDSFFKGAIDNFSVATLNGGFDSGSDLDFFADTGITFSGVAGDINQDGDVDNDDYTIWSEHVGFQAAVGIGDGTTLLIGDADRSGRIDLWDFRIIQQNALAAGTPLTIGIPEPSTLALIGGAIGCVLSRRRGSRGTRSTPRKSTIVLSAASLVAMSALTAAPVRAAVVVGDDFHYDGPSKILHVGGGFTGNSRYVGGQNGTAGRWTGLWGQIGDGIIVTPAYTPPNPPGVPEPGTPFETAMYDGFFGVQSELFRGFELAETVAANQTLYFGGRFKADLDIGSDGRTVPQWYSPRLFLNRVFGDDRILDINGIPIEVQRDRTLDIALGIESYRNINTAMLENKVVARLGGGAEAKTSVITAPPSDGNWHTVIGKLEVNVAGGANERLTVWFDPTGVETGGVNAQLEADVLPDLTALIGTFHSQGARPLDTTNSPEDTNIENPAELGRSYIDDMAIGTTWQDVAALAVPRLTLRINPSTGTGRLVNTTASTTFALDGYSLESASGALNGVAWNSLDEQNVGNWHQDLATANQLVETNFLGSTPIAPGGSVTLGNLFNVGGAQTVTGRYSTGDGLINLLNVEYSTAGLLGDYDQNNRVDGRDFMLWQRTLGATVPAGTGADGNNSGKIDAEDLAVWRSNFGMSLGTPAVGAVPEPGAAVIACCGASAIFAALARRPRRPLVS